MKSTIIIVAVLSVPFLAFSATIYVPDDYPTIQAGIDAAVDGDTVLVAAGTYLENIDFLGKAITVKSGEGPAVTTIDGGHPVNPDYGSVVTFANDEGWNSVIEGFTITNGTGTKVATDNWMGGGIYCKYSSPTISGNIIVGNQVSEFGFGGGIYGSSPTIQGNIVALNSALGVNHSGGGGINLGGDDAPVVRNNLIIGNSAGREGGGLRYMGGWDLQESPVFVNNVIADNIARMGGGVFCYPGNSGNVGPLFTNNTVVGNYAIDSGGGFYCVNSSVPMIISNTIVWDNGAPTDPQIDGAYEEVQYCNVQGGYSGTGNIDADPLLLAPDDGDYHISVHSPCIDAGKNDAPGMPDTDFDGEARVSDGDGDEQADVDIGCDEVVVIHVPLDYPKIQGAIQDAAEGDTILVAAGTYLENLDFLGKGITVISAQGPDATIIDGGQAGSVVTFQSGEYEDSVLTGFTITNGTGSTEMPFTGGGISCLNSSSPTIKDNKIRSNQGRYGAGIFCHDSSPLIEHNAVFDNEAVLGVGGLGGGIACWNGQALLDANIISSNLANAYGGGICLLQAEAALVNNMILGNHSKGSGGGVGCFTSEPILTNNTLYDNSADVFGGGIYCHQAAAPSITNTIVWNNDAPEGPQLSGTHAVVTYCDVQGGWPGIGNIAEDPKFIDPAMGDFHITKDSPCLDQGNNDTPELPDNDFEGDPRVVSDHVDIGADEYNLGGATIRVPAHYPTIQEGIDAAVEGDTVLVAPGIYVENINFNGKKISLVSEDGAKETTIDGQQIMDSVIRFENDEGPDTLVKGFTITNGSASCGGGIYCSPGADPTIMHCVIVGNSASTRGGGVESCGSLISHCTIRDNEVMSG
ncbi:MAG: right-handed parallel beta-helix repeat-containing protein, partial [Planctomycetota bacterium]